MRLFSLALTALLAGSTFAAEPPALREPPAIGRPLAESSVYISVDMGNSTGGGTGTVLACEGKRSLVVTNAHVVESDAYPVTVTVWSEGKSRTYPATYLGGSTVTHLGQRGNVFEIRVNGPDLALLSVDAELPVADIARKIPPVGTAVQLYGYGGTNGTPPVLKTGKVLPEPGWVEPATKTSIETVNGDSGSGIFNDSEELVSVHWGGAGCRLDVIHEFVATTLERKGVFKRFRDWLVARKINKALKDVTLPPVLKW